MNFKKFKIVSPRDVQSTDNVYENLLINTDHIISIKPIKMVIEDKVTEGYWIRTTNGKKYRAIEVPLELMDVLNDNRKPLTLNGGLNQASTSAEFLN